MPIPIVYFVRSSGVMEALLPLEDELPESVTKVTPAVTMMMES